MKTSRLISAGFLAAAMAASGAVVATAQNAPEPGAEAQAETPKPARHEMHERGKHRGHGHHRGHGRRGGGEMFMNLFNEVDANDDDTVTQDEVDAFRAAKLSEVDSSGDGALSIEEFDTLYREFTRSRMVDMFQDLDADGDGAISPEEMDTRVERMFERMDRDGDGALTLQRPGRQRD